METRSRKRKQSLIPPNPYQRSFIKRKKIPISLNRFSSSSCPSSKVKDLRTRRVFSPRPRSSVSKGTAEDGIQKEVLFNAGVSQIDEKEKLDLGVADGFAAEKDLNVGEIDEGLCEIEKLNQENETAKEKKCQGEGVGMTKSKLKSGPLVPCSRTRVFKNPSSFSYKRMLPFLMDLAKDDANAPQIHPCQKVEKSVGEMTPTSLSTTQEILLNTTEKETLADEHPVDDSHASPTSPLNVECSTKDSPEHHILEPTTPKSPQTSMPFTASKFVIRDLPRLFSELASQAIKDPSDIFSKSNGAPYFVHDIFSLQKSPISVVIPEEKSRTNGNLESGSYVGKQIQSTSPDGVNFCKVSPGTSKDCAPQSHLNNTSDSEMSRCMGENGKDKHPNSVGIGDYEGVSRQSTPLDGDTSCKLGPGMGKDCAMDSHLNNKSNHEISRCTGEYEKDSHSNSVETGSYEGEWIQSTPPDSDAFCKLVPGMSKDPALEGQLSNKSDQENTRCMGGDEKDRHPNSKAKKGILFPSSRMRLYRAPGSFSYRRLLPYLMDLSRQDTNTLGALPCKSIDKTVDDRLPPSLASQDNHKRESSKQILTNVLSLGGGDVFPHTESAEMTSPTDSSNIDCTSLGSHEDPVIDFASTNGVLNSAVQEHPGNPTASEVKVSMIMKPCCRHVETASQIQEDTVGKSNHVKPTHDGTSAIPDSELLIKPLPLLVSPEPLLLKESSTGSDLLPEEVPDDGSILMQKTTTSLKSPGELSLIQEQSTIESPVTPINPSSGSSVGILKKYPLGCRGVCTCLNCSSFRLHAERAFEFSRNQMQDTEEVATELMKELSSIRSLLGSICDSTEARLNFQVPEVKEACARSLRAEEWAKRHMDQMYQELNIHCRIPGLPRPKVRFADKSQMQMATIGDTKEKSPPLG